MSRAGPPFVDEATIPPPTVFVVDDDAAVLKSISRLLRSFGLRVVTFSSPREFLEHYDARVPGCLLLDVAMPGLDGLQLQSALTTKGCPLPVIFLTGQGNIPMSVRAMKRGAVDFLTKPVPDEDLLRAVQSAVAADRQHREANAELNDIQARLNSLTPREREVLEHVVSGQLNKQIATQLGTVEKTIKVHRARVMEKMKAPSLAALVRLAGRGGITCENPSA